jgi:hypothetical protein
MKQEEVSSRQKHGVERSMEQNYGAEAWSRNMEQNHGADVWSRSMEQMH